MINFGLTNTWKGGFVSARISSRMLQYDKDIQKRKSYAADFEVENFENNLHHAINNVGIGDLSLLNGCLYTNIDDIQKHSTMKLVSIITNHKRKSINKNNNLSILIYKNNGYVILLNNWENPKYFIAFFLSFFSFDIGGHVSIVYNPKKGNILLEI